MSAASAVARADFPPPSVVGAFRVYVWELPVRISHWLIVLSVVVLASTGFYIGNPFIVVSGPARDHFVMGWMKVIHYYGAMVFTLAVLSRIAWMFAGNKYARWNQLVPTTRERLANMVRTFKFYTFLRPRPPITIGHNPLAGAVYVVVFLLYLTMIATGLAIYSQSAAIGSPMRAFHFLIPLLGGLQSARWLHHVGMWLLLGFIVHHVYSAVMFSAVERNATTESIFTGYKFVRPSALEEIIDDGDQ
jgi:Ni/Fe-hydrogenase 1 B-type cytochrome subunit